jgi:hypothetical protein
MDQQSISGIDALGDRSLVTTPLIHWKWSDASEAYVSVDLTNAYCGCRSPRSVPLVSERDCLELSAWFFNCADKIALERERRPLIRKAEEADKGAHDAADD